MAVVLVLAIGMVRAEETRPSGAGRDGTPAPAPTGEMASAEDSLPRVRAPEPVHDFGQVDQGAELEHVFRILNEGGAILRLSKPRAWCDCTATMLGEPSIPAGAEGAVRVRFDVGRRRGRFRKSVVLGTNDPEHPELVLTLGGTIREILSVDPSCIALPDLTRGERTVRELRLVDGQGQQAKILGVETSSPHIRAHRETDDGQVLEDRMWIEILGEFPQGTLREEIWLRTSHPDFPRLRVPVLGWVSGRLRVDPSWCSLRVVEPGDRPSQKLQLTVTGEKPLEVHAATVEEPYLSVQVEPLEPGRRFEIRIALTADPPEGTTRTRALLLTDDADQPELSVPIHLSRAASNQTGFQGEGQP